MSDESDDKGKAAAPEADEELDAEALAALEAEAPAFKALLKRSLAPAGAGGAEVPDTAGVAGGAAGASASAAETAAPSAADAEKDRALLLAVQKKLRQRSKGKFYADGWSTTQSRMNYGLIAGIMLVVIVAVYLALGPMGISLH